MREVGVAGPEHIRHVAAAQSCKRVEDTIDVVRKVAVGGAGDLHRLLLSHGADGHRHSGGHAIMAGWMAEYHGPGAKAIDFGLGGGEIHLHAAHLLGLWYDL